MGRKVFRGIGDKVACFEEPNTVGSVLNIDAPRNAPLKTPINYLSTVTWHSDFDQFELAVAPPIDVSINHTALATVTNYYGIDASGGVVSGPISVYFAVTGAVREGALLLYNHNLGYKPRVKVTVSGRAISPGQTIQTDANGCQRSVSVFVTTTGVYIQEIAIAGFSNLAAMSLTYRVFVFRQAQAALGAPLFSKAGALTRLARDIVRSDRSYLRRTGVGDQEFSMDLGPTIDIHNGQKRVANGGVLATEAGYGGGMAAPPFILVGL